MNSTSTTTDPDGIATLPAPEKSGQLEDAKVEKTTDFHEQTNYLPTGKVVVVRQCRSVSARAKTSNRFSLSADSLIF
jgi:hypothetical protein